MRFLTDIYDPLSITQAPATTHPPQFTDKEPSTVQSTGDGAIWKGVAPVPIGLLL